MAGPSGTVQPDQRRGHGQRWLAPRPARRDRRRPPHPRRRRFAAHWSSGRALECRAGQRGDRLAGDEMWRDGSGEALHVRLRALLIGGEIREARHPGVSSCCGDGFARHCGRGRGAAQFLSAAASAHARPVALLINMCIICGQAGRCSSGMPAREGETGNSGKLTRSCGRDELCLSFSSCRLCLVVALCFTHARCSSRLHFASKLAIAGRRTWQRPART